MPATDVLLVLIFAEAGLRSTLTARLSLLGVDLVTAHGLHDPALARSLRKPAVLVVDDASVCGRSEEWIDSLLGDPLWRDVVVLGEVPPAARDPRLLQVDRNNAVDAIAALLPRWQA